MSEIDRLKLLAQSSVVGGDIKWALERLEKVEAQVARLNEVIAKIQAVSCGEETVPDIEIYSAEDSDALNWIFKLCFQTLAEIKEEG